MAGAVSLRGRSSLELGVQSLTLEGAIEHLVGAAQGVVENEIQLAKLEARVTATRILRGAVLVLIGAFLLGGATVAAAMAGYAAFPPEVSPVVRLVIIAGVAAMLGLAFAALGAHRIGHERD
jgi:sterol desaturase/sphingolipid hydroxylase (fatty acid hydroxylase superfamily)